MRMKAMAAVRRAGAKIGRAGIRKAGPAWMAGAALLAAWMAAGCSYVKPMSPALRKAVTARDTIYVLPPKAEYRVKGFFTKPVDAERSRRIGETAGKVLAEEAGKVFPSATVVRVADGDAERVLAEADGATVIACEVKGFQRTLPREIVSETLNVLLMVPTFSLSMGYPIQTTSNVYLKVRRPGAAKAVKLKHRDIAQAYDERDLRFQIRILLDPDWQDRT